MADNSSEEIASTQKSLQSGHDPGWNDPPKWALSTGNTSGTPAKRLLNKRVAFPLSSNPSQSNSSIVMGQLPPSNLPPPPVQSGNLTTAPHAPRLAPSGMEKNMENDSGNFFNKTETLHRTLENFENVMNHELESSNVEDVKKRLEVMKGMWNDDKLNEIIQKQVFSISTALMNKDTDTADKLHVSLMMDHASLCNTWIPGIRHLIIELRKKNTQSNSHRESSTQPFFLLNPAESKNV